MEFNFIVSDVNKCQLQFRNTDKRMSYKHSFRNKISI